MPDPYIYAIYGDNNIIKWSLKDLITQKGPILSSSPSTIALGSTINPSTVNPNASTLNLNAADKKKIKFAKRAVNQEGTLMVDVEGNKTLRLKDLNHYTEEILDLDKCPDII